GRIVRRGGAAPGARRAARPRRPRRSPAGHRRPGGLPAPARGGRRAGADAHRARRGGRPRGWPRRRGRRLPRQAVRGGRAAGAGAGAAAAPHADHRRRATAGRPHARPSHADRAPRRPRPHAHAQGVRPARAVLAAPPPGAHPRAALRARLGLRLRRPVERARRVRRPPAREARGRRSAPPAAHGARRGLRATRGLMSLSLRLTLWYTAITAVALLAASAIVYLSVAGNLQRDIDASLASEAEGLARAVTIQGGLPLRPLRLVLPDLNTFSGGDLLIQVVDARGTVLDRSESLGRVVLPVDAETRRALADGNPRYATVAVPGGQLRVYVLPLVLGGQVVGALQVARSLAPMASATTRVLQALAAVNVLLLLLAAGAGWAMARGALRPIAAVRDTAEAIGSSGDLARRVPAGAARDEVGALAATFNRMLDRLQAALAAQRRFV